MRTQCFALVVVILATAATLCCASYQDDVVVLINDLRVSNGLNALTVSPELNLAAQTYAEYLLTTGQLTHFPSDGSSPTSRAIKAGYRGIGETSELLTAAISTPQQAFTIWTMSPAHKMGMLTAYFKDIGVGYAYDPKYLRDSKHNYGRVWVVMLGSGADPAFSAEPVIGSIVPTSGPVDTRVRVYGKNFGSRSEAWFNGVKARIAYQSNTMLLVYVPTGASTGAVSVRNLISGKATVGPTFTVSSDPGPAIMSVSPDSGAVGDTVMITGFRFGASAGKVKFKGVAAAATYWSDRAVRVETPDGAMTGPVSILTAGGSESNSVQFTVETTVPAAPSIAQIQPTAFKPGQTVKIYGSNFGDSGLVNFEDLSAEVVCWSDEIITTVAPADAACGCIVVTNEDGLKSNPTPYTIAKAIIDGISPTAGPPDTEVTITGSGFGNSGTVAFDGVEAAVVSWSDTTIKVKAPSNAHSGKISVRTEDGEVIQGPEFVVEYNINPTLVFTGRASGSLRPNNHLLTIDRDGNMEAILEWTGDAKLDVRLYVRAATRWRFVARSAPEGGAQALRRTVSAGSYLLQVCSTSGAADYKLTVRLP